MEERTSPSSLRDACITNCPAKETRKTQRDERRNPYPSLNERETGEQPTFHTAERNRPTDRPTESLRSPLPPLVRGLSHNTTALRCPSALSSSSAVSDRKGGSRVESRMNIPLLYLAAIATAAPPRSLPDADGRQLDASSLPSFLPSFLPSIPSVCDLV